ncbi:MAG: ubiquinol-cytochrome c reductase iron-sulfur subunit [Deltaproteobacteria bacterium]|nr:ubiquinol-cytochrome c reductase iron-sulfur subunit [Deltaproteobacteria bacterium]MBT4526741.1 ubiquinol-cytochrome c reductase iron-sulfur subunit [Deltaproteobacteria bacterium]
MKKRNTYKACQPDRRLFFKLGLGSLFVTTFTSVAAALKFLTPPIQYETSQVFEAGKIKDFNSGKVKNMQMGEKKISLIKEHNKLYALVRTCTHMGCIPNFNASENAFVCPCHGSKFDIQGNVLRGPAPEPLYRASLSVNKKGRVEVNTAIVENHVTLRDSKPFALDV